MSEYDYKIICTEEEEREEDDFGKGGTKQSSSSRSDSHQLHYPGNRRTCLNGGPPRGTVLVKTGGNALQAVDVKSANCDDVVSVVIPEGMEAGESMLVSCPNGRVVSMTIPPRASPGHVVLLRIPPMDQPVEPVVVTGIPVQNVNPNLIVDAEETDLELKVENEKLDHDFEMVPRPHANVV